MASKKGFKPPVKKEVSSSQVKDGSVRGSNALSNSQYEEIFDAVLHFQGNRSPVQAESMKIRATEPGESASTGNSQCSQVNSTITTENVPDNRAKGDSETQTSASKQSVPFKIPTKGPADSESSAVGSSHSEKPKSKRPKTLREALKVQESSSQYSNSLSQLGSCSLRLTQDAVLTQPPKNLRHRERLQWLQDRRGVGLYIQCDNCKKWRWSDIDDPVDVPKKWTCRLNPDKNYNACIIPEKPISVYIEEDLIHNDYTAGSIVWAKLFGYPWWPAMVDDCPDTEQYYWLDGYSDIPTHYHVVFFDYESNEISRSWVALRDLVSFKHEPRLDDKFSMKPGHKSRITSGKRQAQAALKLRVKERLQKYSFLARWTREIITPPASDSELLAAASPESRRAGTKRKYRKSASQRELTRDTVVETSDEEAERERPRVGKCKDKRDEKQVGKGQAQDKDKQSGSKVENKVANKKETSDRPSGDGNCKEKEAKWKKNEAKCKDNETSDTELSNNGTKMNGRQAEMNADQEDSDGNRAKGLNKERSRGTGLNKRAKESCESQDQKDAAAGGEEVEASEDEQRETSEDEQAEASDGEAAEASEGEAVEASEGEVEASEDEAIETAPEEQAQSSQDAEVESSKDEPAEASQVEQVESSEDEQDAKVESSQQMETCQDEQLNSSQRKQTNSSQTDQRTASQANQTSKPSKTLLRKAKNTKANTTTRKDTHKADKSLASHSNKPEQSSKQKERPGTRNKHRETETNTDKMDEKHSQDEHVSKQGQNSARISSKRHENRVSDRKSSNDAGQPGDTQSFERDVASSEARSRRTGSVTSSSNASSRKSQKSTGSSKTRQRYSSEETSSRPHKLDKGTASSEQTSSRSHSLDKGTIPLDSNSSNSKTNKLSKKEHRTCRKENAKVESNSTNTRAQTRTCKSDTAKGSSQESNREADSSHPGTDINLITAGAKELDTSLHTLSSESSISEKSFEEITNLVAEIVGEPIRPEIHSKLDNTDDERQDLLSARAAEGDQPADDDQTQMLAFETDVKPAPIDEDTSINSEPEGTYDQSSSMESFALNSQFLLEQSLPDGEQLKLKQCMTQTLDEHVDISENSAQSTAEETDEELSRLQEHITRSQTTESSQTGRQTNIEVGKLIERDVNVTDAVKAKKSVKNKGETAGKKPAKNTENTSRKTTNNKDESAGKKRAKKTEDTPGKTTKRKERIVESDTSDVEMKRTKKKSRKIVPNTQCADSDTDSAVTSTEVEARSGKEPRTKVRGKENKETRETGRKKIGKKLNKADFTLKRRCSQDGTEKRTKMVKMEAETRRSAGKGSKSDSKDAKSDSKLASDTTTAKVAKNDTKVGRQDSKTTKSDSKTAQSDTNTKKDAEVAKNDTKLAKSGTKLATDTKTAKSDAKVAKIDSQLARSTTKDAKSDTKLTKSDTKLAKSNSKVAKSNTNTLSDTKIVKNDTKFTKSDTKLVKSDTKLTKLTKTDTKLVKSDTKLASIDSNKPSTSGLNNTAKKSKKTKFFQPPLRKSSHSETSKSEESKHSEPESLPLVHHQASGHNLDITSSQSPISSSVAVVPNSEDHLLDILKRLSQESLPFDMDEEN